MKDFFKNIQTLLIVALVVIILFMRSCGGGKTVIEPKIITKIERFNQKSKKLVAVAERPVQIGGTVRGIINKDNGTLPKAYDSLMVSAKDFYIKAITIEHK